MMQIRVLVVSCSLAVFLYALKRFYQRMRARWSCDLKFASSLQSTLPVLEKPIVVEQELHTVFDPTTCTEKGKCRVQGRKGQTHELYYEVHGTGPRRAIMIMGLGNSSLAYQNQLTYFTSPLSPLAPDHTICVFDNRGVGHSDVPKGPYTTKEMAEDALSLMKHIGWVRKDGQPDGMGMIDVVGLSLGGMIAMELATMIPKQISSLSLCVTTPGYGALRNLPPWKGLLTTIQLLNTRNRQQRMNLIVDMLFPKSWLAQPVSEDSDSEDGLIPERTNLDKILKLFEWRLANSKSQSVAGNLAQSSAALTHYVSPKRLRMLNDTIPKILILTGDEDHMVAKENSFYMHKIMPRSELVVWEQTGHAINVQRDSMYNRLLERVWDEGRGVKVA